MRRKGRDRERREGGGGRESQNDLEIVHRDKKGEKDLMIVVEYKRILSKAAGVCATFRVIMPVVDGDKKNVARWRHNGRVREWGEVNVA